MGKHLAQILSETANVSEEDYKEALKAREARGGSIGEALLQGELVSETRLLEARGILYDLPFRPRLPLDAVGNEFTRRVPMQFLKQHVMVPLKSLDGDQGLPDGDAPAEPSCTIAINDPANFQALDDLVRILDLEDYLVVLSTKSAIISAINVSYDLNRDSAERLVQDMEESGGSIISEIEETADLLDDISDAPIIKLVNHIISQSVKARSSDIHIEPSENHFKVRYRVDGILYDLLTPPKWIQPALISRIKVMAELDIAEKRLPQDGRMGIKLGDQEIDVRVSTIPTTFGERVVLRILNKSSALLTLPELGLAPDLLGRVENLVKSPNGVILVTGPTGSGKTTTLYAILSSINTPDINIITIEDPVEYKIKGV
ncbi:MAG: Flp pilus assembly complex ATPase component, partial [Desulfobacterales bacterium]|nr:Flp pilus assembly complex ATPase component [Desulfobacterales bacterium]